MVWYHIYFLHNAIGTAYFPTFSMRVVRLPYALSIFRKKVVKFYQYKLDLSDMHVLTLEKVYAVLISMREKQNVASEDRYRLF